MQEQSKVQFIITAGAAQSSQIIQTIQEAYPDCGISQPFSAVLSFSDTRRIQHQIARDGIIWVKSDGHILEIQANDALYQTRQYTLAELEKLLYPQFIRCHKQYLVQRTAIRNLDATNRLLHTVCGIIPCGKQYLNNL